MRFDCSGWIARTSFADFPDCAGVPGQRRRKIPAWLFPADFAQNLHAESSSNGSSRPAFAQILVRTSEPQISFGIGDEQRERSGVVVHGDG